MMQQKKLLNDEFWKYIIPAMLIQTMSVLYGIVDGFFVGRAMGDMGLAAINIGWPIAAFITALATGIGIGGSVLMSTKQGEADLGGARKARGNTVSMLLFFTVISTIFFSLFKTEILSFLGAEGPLLQMAEEYIRVIALGAACQIFSVGINPLLRNIGKPKAAMIFMIVGLFGNIIFDALFILVFDWQLFGAALATVVGQALAAIMALYTLYSSKKHPSSIKDLKPNKEIIGKIARISLSPFGLTFAPSLIIIITNWQALRFGGHGAVAAYSIISYMTQAIQSVFQGAGDGIQPLISYYNGSGRYHWIEFLKTKTIKFTTILSIAITAIFILLRNWFPVVFGASATVATIASIGMVISSLSFVFTSLSKFACSFFYAVHKPHTSNALAYLDPVLISPLLLVILPTIFGVTGIWLALPVSQIITCIISIFLLRNYKKDIQPLLEEIEAVKETKKIVA